MNILDMTIEEVEEFILAEMQKGVLKAYKGLIDAEERLILYGDGKPGLIPIGVIGIGDIVLSDRDRSDPLVKKLISKLDISKVFDIDENLLPQKSKLSTLRKREKQFVVQCINPFIRKHNSKQILSHRNRISKRRRGKR